MIAKPDRLQPNDPLIGRTVLGRFEILRPLARGGMGVLYLARTRGAQGFVRPVVVKRLGMDATPDAIKMFVREAHVMASLHHPNIVQAIDFNSEGDEYLLVMEYVEGYSLARWAKFVKESKRSFDVQAAVQVVIDVLEALAHAHALVGVDGHTAGVIHRDVTPSNVMVSTEGHVKLLDFGIARVEHDKTVEGPEGPTIKGKFAFLAPELLSDGEPSASSDVYSAALVLHELLLGRNEFAADDLTTTLVNVAKKIPTRIDAVRSDVPAAIGAVLERALEKDPKLRYATANELAAALRAARGVDSEQVRASMVRQIREDFFSPSMLTAMQGFDVQTLAKAWQTSGAVTTAKAVMAAEQPTLTEAFSPALDGGTSVAPASYANVIDASRPSGPNIEITSSGPDRTSPTQRPPRTPEPEERGSKGGGLVLAAWVAAFAAVAALGAAALVLYRTQNSGGQGFVVVEGQTNGTTPATTDAGVASNEPVADSGATTIDDSGATAGDPGPARALGPQRRAVSADEEARLTGQFARYRPRVEACARRFASEASETRIEAIRFAVDRAGTVRAAELLPEGSGATALGACVIGVARGARFSSSESGLTFRLPLSLRIAPR
ncbi:MAG: serine/threonine protein kinase [Myxococcales bacterium]|nr:serine/threonine protein kinase [Myxococcales bacterium]